MDWMYVVLFCIGLIFGSVVMGFICAFQSDEALTTRAHADAEWARSCDQLREDKAGLCREIEYLKKRIGQLQDQLTAIRKVVED